MNIQSGVRLSKKLESAIVILLFIFYMNPSVSLEVQQAMKYSGYGLIALLIFISMLKGWQQFVYVATLDIFPWILLGICISSVVWSAAPEYTSDEVDPVIRATLFAVYLTFRYTLKEQMWLIAWALGIVAVLSLVCALTLPTYAIDDFGRWKGILTHKQYLGRFMVLGFITFLNIALDEPRYRWLTLIGAGLAIALILLSQSKSALILLTISMMILPLYKLKQQYYRTRTVIITSLLLFFGCIAVLIGSNLETILVDILGKNLEFNGRIPLWSSIIEKGLERPWLGYGYAAFWPSDAGFFVLRLTPWAPREDFHAHNGFIEVFVQIGFLGLLLCLVSFVTLIFRTFHLINSTSCREFWWLFQFLIILFLTNLSEYSTFVAGNIEWALYTSMSLSTIVECNCIKQKVPLPQKS